MEYYYVITMESRKGKQLYFCVTDKEEYIWSFDRNEAIWFNTDIDALKFCKMYFKKFKDYKVKEIEYQW